MNEQEMSLPGITSSPEFNLFLCEKKLSIHHMR